MRSVVSLTFFIALLIHSHRILNSLSGHQGSFPLFAFAMDQTAANNDLVANVQLAIQHHKNGNTEEAIRFYELVIPKLAGKTKASLCGNVGALYMSNGEYERARDHFMTSVEADPENASAHFNLAVVLTTKLGEHAKAIKHCGKAMKLDPNNHKALHLMGNIMQNIGRPEDAAKYFVAAENIALQTQEESSQARATDNATPQHALQKLQVFNTKVGEVLRTTHEGRDFAMECVSTSPLVFVIDDLIDEKECEHIVNRADKLLEKSFVMGGMGGEYQVSDTGSSEPLTDTAPVAEETVDPALYRSSYNAWLSQDSVLNQLQQRLAVVLDLPAAYLKTKSEELQVVRYGPGGQFKVHQDSSAFNSRLVTALLYLNTVHEDSVEAAQEKEKEQCAAVQGGETWFPYATTTNDGKKENDLLAPSSVEGAIEAALRVYEAHVETTDPAGASPVCLPGLKIVPKRGRAVVFFNHLSSGIIDPGAVHAGLPVQVKSPESFAVAEGGQSGATHTVEKWVANYWVELDVDLLSQYLE